MKQKEVICQMDYTAKLLKGLYEVIDLLKDIKKQNAVILKRLEEKTGNELTFGYTPRSIVFNYKQTEEE